MSPLSPPVLLATGATSSPALWAALVDGTLPIDVALTRVLLILLGCWMAFSMLSPLIYPPAPVQREASDGESPS